jgi:hypothetical protein
LKLENNQVKSDFGCFNSQKNQFQIILSAAFLVTAIVG